MNVRWRGVLGPAALEAALLALGVALALAAEEWREGRREREQGATATAAIREEVRANRAAVAAAAAYHASLLDSLRARAAIRAPAPGAALFRRGFVAPAPVATAAWQTAAETGALEHVPHALVLRLSRAYGAQGRYERQAEAVGSLLYGELYRGGVDSIAARHRTLSHLIGAFLYRERELTRLYDATLAGPPPRQEVPPTQ